MICTWSLPARTASSSCDFDNPGTRNRRRTDHAQDRVTPSSLGMKREKSIALIEPDAMVRTWQQGTSRLLHCGNQLAALG